MKFLLASLFVILSISTYSQIEKFLNLGSKEDYSVKKLSAIKRTPYITSTIIEREVTLVK